MEDRWQPKHVMSAIRAPTSIVTGGAGFIGSAVTDQLIRLGHRVVVLDDLSGGCPENIHSAATLVTGSTLDDGLVDRLFQEYRFDYVFHLAAYAAECLSHRIRRFNYTNNVVGSVNLINAAVNHEARCFVFVSSIAVYGTNQVPLTEAMPPQPEDPYGIAKYAVEMDLRAARDAFGLDSIVFRPHNVYGERQNIADCHRNVVGIFMSAALNGKPLPIFGDGEQSRAFSYVLDVAPLIAESVHREQAYNEVFNVGADRPCTVNELGRMVCAAMNATFRPRYLPARHEVQHAYAAHDKADRVFGCRRGFSLAEGIDRMATWAKQARPQRKHRFDRLEIVRATRRPRGS
jgi:UDP-glucose 4-epimerase